MSLLLPKLDRPIPVFPLPNLVMFPHAIQFLHMFEPRYRQMMRDVVRRSPDERFVAMALLEPGYDAKYHTNFAEIYDTVCVGLVVRYERQHNGTYNLILRGLCRARVIDEDGSGPYRLARVEPFGDDVSVMSFDERVARKQLQAVVQESAFDSVPQVATCRSWIRDDLPVSALIDLLAFHLVPDTETDLKQQLLSQADLVRRHELLRTNLETLGRVLQAARDRWRTWPPTESEN